jgi:hypothetical protein
MGLSLDVVRRQKCKKRLVQIFLTFMLEDELDSFKGTISKPTFCKEIVNQSILQIHAW